MQKYFLLACLIVSSFCLTLSGCGDRPSAGESAEVTVYQVKGEVRKIPEGGATIVIHHEEIPGYMMEMTMPFMVKEEAELEGLKAGDAVAFEYHVAEEGSWIEKIEVQAAPTEAEQ